MNKKSPKLPQVWKAPVLAFYVLMFFFGIFAGVGGSQNMKGYSWLMKDKRTFLGWQHLFWFTLKIIHILSIRKHICVCVHRGGAWGDYVLLGVLHDRVQCHQSSHVSFYHQPSILHDRVSYDKFLQSSFPLSIDMRVINIATKVAIIATYRSNAAFLLSLSSTRSLGLSTALSSASSSKRWCLCWQW